MIGVDGVVVVETIGGKPGGWWGFGESFRVFAKRANTVGSEKKYPRKLQEVIATKTTHPRLSLSLSFFRIDLSPAWSCDIGLKISYR
jgi:hypothetical protein